MGSDLWRSYNRFILRAMRFVAILAIAVAAFIGIFVLTDLMRMTHFGYPDWTILLLVFLIAVLYGLQRLIAYWIRVT
jgi:hypothetical protein